MDKLNSYLTHIQPYNLFGKCYYYNTSATPSMIEGAQKIHADTGISSAED
jgi:hypothetical protein